MINPMYEFAKIKPKALIFDIDGVVCDSSKRFKRLDVDAHEKRDKERFLKSVEHYNSDCEGDVEISLGRELLEMLVKFYQPKKVFFITARGSGGYEPTMEWFKSNKIWKKNFELIMHPEDLSDSDWEFSSQESHAEFKKREAKKILQEYDVVYAVDDGEYNVQAYKSLGIPVLKFQTNIDRVLV